MFIVWDSGRSYHHVHTMELTMGRHFHIHVRASAVSRYSAEPAVVQDRDQRYLREVILDLDGVLAGLRYLRCMVPKFDAVGTLVSWTAAVRSPWKA